MINHARTLLLNKSANFFVGGQVNEYVPPSFVPILLDEPLTRIYNTLVPTGLDATATNYVAAALLKILECPELVPYAHMFDSRTTYQNSAEILAKLTDDPVPMEIHKSAACDIVPHYTISGENQPSNVNVSGSHTWTCTVVDSEHMQIASSRGDTTVVYVINPDTPTRSRDIPLITDYLSIYFDLPSQELTGACNITYSTVVAVPYNAAQKLRALTALLAQPQIRARLFKPADVYATQLSELESIWTHAHECILSFGALILAYLIQCEMLRQLTRSGH